MITITKNGNAVLFEFEENQHYLYNGTIEVPLNSLSLVTDESEMFTFKKAATNDIFISARYDDVNMSKSQLIDFYIANMVGSTGGGSESGVTSGDVQTMIDTSLEDYYDIDEIDAALSGKADSSAVTEEITAAVSGKADSTAVTQEISAAVSGKADSSAVTEAINAAVSGKADSSSVYTKSEVDTALSGKQDISGMTAYTTSSDVETYVSGFTYDKATIDSKVASGGTFDPTNYYDKTATDALLDNKFDASAFTSYSAATDARISEDEEVTAAALNALNDGKQDTLIAGSGITISGNVISAEGGNLVIELTEAEYDALVSGGTVDPNAFYIITDATEINISDYYTSAQTQSAINAAVSGKQDTLIAGSGITISGNVISANGGGSITVDTALDSSSTNPVENRVIYNKFDEVEQVTAAALNALNEELSGKADSSDVTDAINSAVSGKADSSSVYTKSEVDTALSGKQDTLIAGTNIKTINNESILGSGNITIQGGGGGKAVSGGTNISITTGETADTINCTLPISGYNSNILIKDGSNDISLSSMFSQAFGSGNTIAAYGGYNQNCITVEGINNSCGTMATHVEGGYNIGIYGSYSHVEGAHNQLTVSTTHDKVCSHVEGKYNKVLNYSEHASGQYNVSNKANTTWGDSGNTLFSVGNGHSNTARHNAFEIRQNGDIYCSDGTNDVKLQDTITATAANTTALGGLKLVKLTKSEYDALSTKDSNTLFVIIN